MRLFPVLGRVPVIAERVQRWFAPVDAAELRRRAFDALRDLLRRLTATRPVVIAIDDQQWDDADSAAFLGELVGDAEPPALLLVACYRSEDESTSVLVRDLLRRPPPHAELRTLTLSPLTDDDARDLVARLRVDGNEAARADAILREAGGSPLFLSELARTADGDGEGLDNVLLTRIERMTEDARALIAVCCVAGRPLRTGLALRAAGVTAGESALAQLRAARVVRLRQGANEPELEPYHDRLREAMLRALPPPRHRELHAALARTIAAEAEPDRAALVEHWLAAGDTARAVEHALAVAADDVLAVGFHRAAGLYQIALEHGELGPDERRRLHVRRAEVLAHAGRLDEAAAAFAMAAEGAEPRQRRDLKRRELEQLMRRGHVGRGLEESRALLAEVGFPMPRSLRSAISSVVWERLRLRLGGLEFCERDAADVPSDTLEQLDVVWSLISPLSFAHPIVGRAIGVRYLRRALAAGEPLRVARGLNLEVGYSAMRGYGARVVTEDLAARCRRLAKRLGDPYLIGIIDGSSAIASFVTGHFREARDRLLAAETYLRDHCADVRWELDLTALFSCSALWYLGETRELTRRVPVHLREARELGDVYAEYGILTWRSNCAWLVLDRPDEARANVHAAEMSGGVEGFHLHHYYQLLAHTQIDLYVGDAARALERVESAWRLVERSMLRRVETVRIESSYLRARCALAAAAAGIDPSANLRRARKMARDLTRAGAPWGHALAFAVRAQVTALDGSTDEAATLLQNAIDALAAADMSLYAAAARRRLAALAGSAETFAGADAATAQMLEQSVVDVDAMTRMLFPGFRAS